MTGPPPLIYKTELNEWERIKNLTNDQILKLIEGAFNELSGDLDLCVYVQTLRKRLDLKYKFPLNDPHEFGYKINEVVKLG